MIDYINNESLIEPTPSEVRQRIDTIPSKLTVTMWRTMEHPDGFPLHLDGAMIRSLNMFLHVTGCRISEAITKQAAWDAARVGMTGNLLDYSIQDYNGEEALVWQFHTLKRSGHPERIVAFPLSPDYEPYSKEILQAWEKTEKNPWHITRVVTYHANREIFQGFGYMIEPQRIVKDGKVIFEADKHMKKFSDHAHRHIRSRELTFRNGFTDNDLMVFFGWSPITMGKNPWVQRYQNLRWQDYFPKLLRRL